MVKEKLISYISKYLLATTLIMMLGLINEDRGLRGLPFAWLWAFGSQKVDIPRFIMSFICILAAVIAADIIAKAIIRVREPSLKTLTKEASAYPVTDISRAGKSFKNTGKKQAADAAEESATIAEVDSDPDLPELIDESVQGEHIELSDIGVQEGKDIPEPKLKEILTKTAAKSKEGSNPGPGVAIAVLIGILSIIFPMIGLFDDDDSYDDVFMDDGQFYFATDDVTYYGTENEEYIDQTKLALTNLFDDMVNENSPLGDFTNEEETVALLELCVWENMQVQIIEIFIDENKGTSISRFVINDDYGNSYLAAVLMDITRTEVNEWDEDEEDVYAEYDTTIRGMSVLPGEGDTFVSEIAQSGSGVLTDEDVKDAVKLGQTTYEDVNILLWRKGKGDLHLEAEESEAA